MIAPRAAALGQPPFADRAILAKQLRFRAVARKYAELLEAALQDIEAAEREEQEADRDRRRRLKCPQHAAHEITSQEVQQQQQQSGVADHQQQTSQPPPPDPALAGAAAAAAPLQPSADIGASVIDGGAGAGEAVEGQAAAAKSATRSQRPAAPPPTAVSLLASMAEAAGGGRQAGSGKRGDVHRAAVAGTPQLQASAEAPAQRNGKRARVAKGKKAGGGKEGGYLSGLCIYVVRLGSVTRRIRDMLLNRVLDAGGAVTDTYDAAATTHVVADASVPRDAILAHAGWGAHAERDSVVVASLAWLQGCLAERALLPLRTDIICGPGAYVLPSQCLAERALLPLLTENIICSPGAYVPPEPEPAPAAAAEAVARAMAAVDAQHGGIPPRPDAAPPENDGGAGYGKTKLACQRKASDARDVWGKGAEKPNKFIADVLSEIGVGFRFANWVGIKVALLFGRGDRRVGRWRSYSAAATVVSGFKRPLKTAEDLRGVRGLGAKMVQNIAEIIETGDLELKHALLAQLKPTKDLCGLKPMKDLCGVWGLGPMTAKKLIEMGITSIPELRRRAAEDRAKSLLTHQQAIGLRYYEELQQRMQRDEATAIVGVVSAAVQKLCPGAGCIAMGSYRRGKETCGDVDVLVVPPSGQEVCEWIMQPLLALLHDQNFLTDDLAGGPTEATQNFGHFKHRSRGTAPEESVNPLSKHVMSYMGVCQLSPTHSHRRIDIKVYPRSLSAFAMLYFTGSDYFNRSMRFHAIKMGRCLSDKGLYPVTRGSKGEILWRGNLCKGLYPVTSGSKGEILWRGKSIACMEEKDVFDALGLEYRAPHERSIDESTASAMLEAAEDEEGPGDGPAN
ncbi:hypothetical protein JKP88DRAFT_354458 [Tribonema minus]|uniref:DNA polymerase beta n=1 Tax=Tribonema minus TaxID=303371 RepID=A0A835YYU5_9STRA|nr:hypothetical protein JKP88DRAFT_354458 [Tribonema minus]